MGFRMSVAGLGSNEFKAIWKDLKEFGKKGHERITVQIIENNKIIKTAAEITIVQRIINYVKWLFCRGGNQQHERVATAVDLSCFFNKNRGFFTIKHLQGQAFENIAKHYGNGKELILIIKEIKTDVIKKNKGSLKTLNNQIKNYQQELSQSKSATGTLKDQLALLKDKLAKSECSLNDVNKKLLERDTSLKEHYETLHTQEAQTSKPLAKVRKLKDEDDEIDFSTALKHKMGNEWLKIDNKKLVEEKNIKLLYRVGFKLLRNEHNYPAIFPNRVVRREDVSKLSLEQINSLPFEDLLAIIDLLSNKQAWNFLNDPAISFNDKKYALLAFNDVFGEEFAQTIQKQLSAPINSKTIEEADTLFEKLLKYTPQQFKELDPKRVKILHEKRCNASNTFAETCFRDTRDDNSIAELESWENMNNKELAQGLIGNEISLYQLSRINLITRNQFNLEAHTELQSNALAPIRPVGTIAHIKENACVPPKQIQPLLEVTLKWINDELKKCDNGKSNPIVVAALANQRLVTIHPFPDGNGRTSRFVADMILRKYGLLPAAWAEEEVGVAIFPQLARGERQTPTLAIEKMISALERSNKIIIGLE